jgi:hypothetical protein
MQFPPALVPRRSTPLDPHAGRDAKQFRWHPAADHFDSSGQASTRRQSDGLAARFAGTAESALASMCCIIIFIGVSPRRPATRERWYHAAERARPLVDRLRLRGALRAIRRRPVVGICSSVTNICSSCSVTDLDQTEVGTRAKSYSNPSADVILAGDVSRISPTWRPQANDPAGQQPAAAARTP